MVKTMSIIIREFKQIDVIEMNKIWNDIVKDGMAFPQTDTLFALRMVYIDGNGAGLDATFDSHGRQQQITIGTRRGYHLISDNGDPDTYLQIINDSTLRMCDSTLTAPQSSLNYDLVRVVK